MRHPKAQPPWGSVQLFTNPFWQKKHSPQKVSTLTVTRSPGFTVVTSAPICSTIPTISCPTVIPGTARGTLPCLMCRSLVQILPSVTRTMASVCPLFEESVSLGDGSSLGLCMCMLTFSRKYILNIVINKKYFLLGFKYKVCFEKIIVLIGLIC